PNGHVLIADENNNRVIEVTVDQHIVAQFTGAGSVSGAAFASRLPNGNTLISDSNNNRIIEVDPTDNIVWQYATNLQRGSNPAPLPTRAVRLRSGHTLISDQFNNRVIEETRAGEIVYQQGALNVAGAGFNHVNGHYDAKAIGAFTGLTPPFNCHSPAEPPAGARRGCAAALSQRPRGPGGEVRRECEGSESGHARKQLRQLRALPGQLRLHSGTVPALSREAREGQRLVQRLGPADVSYS